MAVSRSGPDGLPGMCCKSSGVRLLALPIIFGALLPRGEGAQDRPNSRSQAPKSDPAPISAPNAPPMKFGEPRIRITDGPDDGLTLGSAIDRFLKENLELRACHDEIAMAQADVEAACQPPQSSLFIGVGASGIQTWVNQPRKLVPRRWIESLVARSPARARGSV